MAGPNGEMDWMHFPWSADVGAYINAMTSKVDTIVLGRKLANTTDPKALNGIRVGQTQGNSPIEVWTGFANELGVDKSSVKIFNLKPPELVVVLHENGTLSRHLPGWPSSSRESSTLVAGILHRALGR